MTIVQVDNPGDQTLNGISTSSYTVEISNTTKVTTAYFLDAITVRTLTPLTYYSPKCKQMITNGSMSIHLAESEDLLDFAYAKWAPGTPGTANRLSPSITVSTFLYRAAAIVPTIKIKRHNTLFSPGGRLFLRLFMPWPNHTGDCIQANSQKSMPNEPLWKNRDICEFANQNRKPMSQGGRTKSQNCCNRHPQAARSRPKAGSAPSAATKT